MERGTDYGNQVFGSRRGSSSHQQNPFVMLAGKQTGEDAGECYGCMLLYSGNFKAEAEKDQYEQTRLVMGLSDEMFSWKLEPGEKFDTPETAFSYSANGFSTLSWNLHRLIRSHICRSAYRDTKRPVLINNWEATYFDFTGEKIIEIAKQVAVAMAGSFGYELDLNLLTEEEKEQVREQIKNYHRFEMLIRQGRYYRLTDVWQKEEYAAWEYCAPDESEALVTVITMDTQCNPATEYVKLRGLGEDKNYRVEVVKAN